MSNSSSEIPGTVSWVRKNDGESFAGSLLGAKLFLWTITDTQSNRSWNRLFKNSIQLKFPNKNILPQGFSYPFLKTFAAVFPDPTDRKKEWDLKKSHYGPCENGECMD